jgi:hypothetical protein
LPALVKATAEPAMPRESPKLTPRTPYASRMRVRQPIAPLERVRRASV